MAVATVGVRTRRTIDAPVDRPVQRAIPAEEAPDPLSPARGILLAAGLGALAWAMVIAALLLNR